MNQESVKNKIYDCVIVGGGPAGVTAAIYLARKKVDFLMIAEDIGGQVAKSYKIENCPSYASISGTELAEKMKKHLEEFDFDFVKRRAENIRRDGDYFSVRTEAEVFKGKSLIIASGARPRMLGVPGEEKFINKGVTYCATCDAPLFAGKEVAVIGGGNTGLLTAMQLMDIASKVYLLDASKRLTGDRVMVEKIKASPIVEILTGAKIKEIAGSDLVEKIKIEHEGREMEIGAQGIFVSIGYLPNAEILEGVVKLNERGEISTDEYGRTSAEGIFAAGDCTDRPYKQIATASGRGCVAALSVYDYLSSKF